MCQLQNKPKVAYHLTFRPPCNRITIIFTSIELTIQSQYFSSRNPIKLNHGVQYDMETNW